MQTIYYELNIPKALITKALRPLWPGVVWSPFSPTRFAVLPEQPLPGPRWIRVRNRQCGSAPGSPAGGTVVFVGISPKMIKTDEGTKNDSTCYREEKKT